MEFQTLQSLSLVRSRVASRRPMPSCHSPQPVQRPARSSSLGCSPTEERPARGLRMWLQGVAPRNESVADSRQPLGRQRRSMLSWVSGLFRVVRLRPCARVLPPGSSHELSAGSLVRTAEAAAGREPSRLPGVFTRSRLAVLSSARQTLLRFPTSSSSSSIRRAARSWLCVHLGCLAVSPP